jgi:cell division protein FtsQ
VSVADRLPRISRRLLLVVAALVAGAAVWTAIPRVLRRLAFFQVRQIELVGIRHLAPEAVIGALRLDASASVFDDLDALTARLGTLRGVVDARVERRLPAALRVIVREVQPVALVPGARGMTLVDEDAQVLPFEPARSAVDLPVAAGADTVVIGLLARVRAVDPALFQRVNAALAWGGGRRDVALELAAGADGRGAVRRVLLGGDAGPEVIQAVARVAADLAARDRAYAELDARYAGQVVVRRRATS